MGAQTIRDLRLAKGRVIDLAGSELRRRVTRTLSSSRIGRALRSDVARPLSSALRRAGVGGPGGPFRAAGRFGSGGPLGAVLAGRAAFRAGQDDLVDDVLTGPGARYPEEAELLLLRSDLEAFRGDYEAALASAEAARLLAPGSEEAALRSIRLHYSARPATVADQNARETLERFGRSAKVLWAASKHCASEEQFERIHAIWRARLRGPAEMARTVRQIGNAALRVERFESAAELYAEAALNTLRGEGPRGAVKEKRLAGKGGLSVIGDLRRVLENGEIPFFLAAGTALGIVRDGRPLDHDDDIDVGILEKDWDREGLIELFRRDPSFDLANPHAKSRKIGLVHRGGAAVDLFRFYREAEHLFHDAVFVRWRNTPFQLEERVLPTGPVLLPSPSDHYLTECYGDWRTPVPGFDAFVEGPNVEVTWPDYFAVHRVRQAYKRICAKDPRAARRELFAAEPLLGRTETGRRLMAEIGSHSP